MADPRPSLHVTEPTTRSLRLRRLAAADVEDPVIVGWHTAAEGYELMNEEPYEDADAQVVLQRWVDAWDRDGYGYWVAERRSDGTPVGIGGVRRTAGPGRDCLNLYYRLAPEARGSGFAREIASAATAFAHEWLPDLPVTCRINPRNEPSLTTAARAGMVDIGPWRSDADPLTEPDSRLHRSPDVVTGLVEPGTAAYDELVDLWVRVNDAGGAVGFEPGAPRAKVAAALDRNLAGGAELVRLVEPTLASWDDRSAYGPVVGFGFVDLPQPRNIAHRTRLYAVMVDPQRRHQNLGRLLLGSLHACARAHDREIVDLGYRGGTGLGDFYATCGYVETGRIPGGLRLSTGDRDDVTMARRLDGHPLLP